MNLSDVEHEQLLAATRSHTMRVSDVRRAKLILMLDSGDSRDAIMNKLECDSRFISRWSSRFLSERLAGMYARHPGTQTPAGKVRSTDSELHPQAQARQRIHALEQLQTRG